MRTAYIRDAQLAGPDQTIEEAAVERPRKPILVRVQPAVFRQADRASSQGQYRAWKDVHWTITLVDVAEGRSFREALTTFFAALGELGPEMVIDALHAVQQIARQRADAEKPASEHAGAERAGRRAAS